MACQSGRDNDQKAPDQGPKSAMRVVLFFMTEEQWRIAVRRFRECLKCADQGLGHEKGFGVALCGAHFHSTYPGQAAKRFGIEPVL